MKIATWNVNGIRARSGQVIDWVAREAPDVVCLQEIKARPDQLRPLLFEPEGYWCRWHGYGGYSGVALLVKKTLAPESPAFDHPAFDLEARIVTRGRRRCSWRRSTCPTAARTSPRRCNSSTRSSAWAGEMRAPVSSS